MPLSFKTRLRQLIKHVKFICAKTFLSIGTTRLIATILTACVFLILLLKSIQSTIVYFQLSSLFKSNRVITTKNRLDDGQIHLFIAIGSAPQNAHLRQAARESWLKWIPNDNSVSYKFFTDSLPISTSTSTTSSSTKSKKIWDQLSIEMSTHDDIIQQPLPTGYGNNEHNAYGQRALFQAKYAVTHQVRFSHFLRIDDDSFLCLHRLLYELKTSPRVQFFWGRFWCKQGRNRADENFMLFSSDIIHLLANEEITGKLLPFDTNVTFGWNFGFWSWVLNLTIFDDQQRIDAQQGYLTTFMHHNDHQHQDYAMFCENFIYAHHVPEVVIRKAYEMSSTHLMYNVPRRRPPTSTCRSQDRSFIPARHSQILPNIKVERVDGR